MPAKKPYKVDIDVVPYLSIMAIVLKLICLILIVMVMRIAINPDALKIIRYEKLYQPPEEANNNSTNTGAGTDKQMSREPVYIDCHPDHVEIQPEGKIISTVDLKEQGGDFEHALDFLSDNTASNFAIVIARPNSAPVYRYVRRELAKRKLTVGYDVLESDVVIQWEEEMKKLALTVKQIEDAKHAMEGRQRKSPAPAVETAPPEAK